MRMLNLGLSILLLAMLTASTEAIVLKDSVGPWMIEFNSSERYNTRYEFQEPEQSGYSYWLLFLIDEAGHEVGWMSFRSYSYPQKASKDFLDEMLDQRLKYFQVTSPTKTSTIVDGTDARMGEGYSSAFSRKWRGAVWAYKPSFDAFTNTNMSKHFINFDSLQDPAEFDQIVNSLHVTNATYM
jgi:hypothetical protein